MKPIVVLVIPNDETETTPASYVFALTSTPAERPSAAAIPLRSPRFSQDDAVPPFWTWFTENPRPIGRSLRAITE